jgi:hypothetical protein
MTIVAALKGEMIVDKGRATNRDKPMPQRRGRE